MHRLTIFFSTHAQSFLDFFEYQDVLSSHGASHWPQAIGQASKLETSPSSAYLLLHRFDFFAT